MSDSAPTNKPSRHFCFTLNNPDAQLLESPDKLMEGVQQLRYAVWQLETGLTGTLHFQGYLELLRPCRFSSFATTNLRGSHFEVRRGSRDQARDYARKEETRTRGPWESGDFGLSPGKRTDLTDCVDAIKRGASLIEIAEEHTAAFVKYHRGVERALVLLSPVLPRSPDVPVDVILVLGPSGCGKTRFCRDASPDAYWKDNGKWWDGYTGQPSVILDDMSGCSMAYRDFKRVCDRYPYRVECKGGSMELAATTFYLTSCSLPDKWWNPDNVREYRFEEIVRRITRCEGWHPERKEFITFLSTPEQHALDKYLESPCHN